MKHLSTHRHVTGRRSPLPARPPAANRWAWAARHGGAQTALLHRAECRRGNAATEATGGRSSVSNEITAPDEEPLKYLNGHQSSSMMNAADLDLWCVCSLVSSAVP